MHKNLIHTTPENMTKFKLIFLAEKTSLLHLANVPSAHSPWWTYSYEVFGIFHKAANLNRER
jgi:hypothetical protein